MTHNHPTQAGKTIRAIVKGDVISVPQYDTPLQVRLVDGDRGYTHAEAVFADVSSDDSPDVKLLFVDEDTGRVFLSSAADGDRGEVEHIEIVSADEAETGDDPAVGEVLENGYAKMTVRGVSFTFDSYTFNGTTYAFSSDGMIHTKIAPDDLPAENKKFLRENFNWAGELTTGAN